MCAVDRRYDFLMLEKRKKIRGTYKGWRVVESEYAGVYKWL